MTYFVVQILLFEVTTYGLEKENCVVINDVRSLAPPSRWNVRFGDRKAKDYQESSGSWNFC